MTNDLLKITPEEIEAMNAAFTEVQNKEHWKYPIDCTLDACDDTKQQLISDAVIFYAGCVPDFERLPNGKVRVTAIGYYNAVGA
jgi:hypothetical protein